MIIDPTSISFKNVTPHCSQIQDILDFFKQIHASLESLESSVASLLTEERHEGQLEEDIHGILQSMLGEDKPCLLSRLLRVRPCSECFRDSQQN